MEEEGKRKCNKEVKMLCCYVASDTFPPRAETEKSLRIAREEQVKDKEHFLAVQAQRDRMEFERVLKSVIN